MTDGNVFARSESAVLTTNKLIKNTYTLLSMTLLFSALTAGISLQTGIGHFGLLGLLGILGLYFVVYLTRNSALGILSVFAFTGFLGLTLGPTLNAYLTIFSNGGQIIMLAMGMTGALFLGLSAYVLTTRKDFSFLSSFLFAGLILALIMGLVAIFFSIPALSLAVSGIVALLMCGMILWHTSDLVQGHETNYIMATVGLYLSIINLFMALLHILGALTGED